MKLYLSKSHSDEDGPLAKEGKLGLIYGSKEELLKLCDFFEEIKKELSTGEHCHLHLRDNFKDWNKKDHIDLEVNLED